MGILDEDIETAICKLGGPVVLFICVPGIFLIFTYVEIRALAAGQGWSLKHLIQYLMVIAPCAWFGVWMCRKGYGWFGGNKS